MRASGSRFQLLQACQWWARPDVPEVPRRIAHLEQVRQLGTEVHALIEAWIERRALPEASPAAYARLDVWRTDPVSVEAWTVEARVAYDVASDTARRLPPAKHRDYSGVRGSELPGTVDAYRVDGDAIVVTDWKVGGVDIDDLSPDADRNEQLKLYALALARLHGAQRAELRVVRIYADHVATSTAALSWLDLQVVALKARAAMARVPQARPQPGRHCELCPAAAPCSRGPALPWAE